MGIGCTRRVVIRRFGAFFFVGKARGWGGCMDSVFLGRVAGGINMVDGIGYGTVRTRWAGTDGGSDRRAFEKYMQCARCRVKCESNVDWTR